MSAPLLAIEGLCAGYGGLDVLHDLTLGVAPGEFVCVIGANTAGKSTILRAISRLVPRVSGTLRFAGTDLMSRSSFETPSLGIAHVPEGRQVFPTLSVRENLVATASNRLKRSSPWTLERVYALFPRLPRVRMDRTLGTRANGQRQFAIGGSSLFRLGLLTALTSDIKKAYIAAISSSGMI